MIYTCGNLCFCVLLHRVLKRKSGGTAGTALTVSPDAVSISSISTNGQSDGESAFEVRRVALYKAAPILGHPHYCKATKFG